MATCTNYPFDEALKTLADVVIERPAFQAKTEIVPEMGRQFQRETEISFAGHRVLLTMINYSPEQEEAVASAIDAVLTQK